jgi:hypothetical protein
MSDMGAPPDPAESNGDGEANPIEVNTHGRRCCAISR